MEGEKMRKIIYFVPYPELIPKVREVMNRAYYGELFSAASIRYNPDMFSQEVDEDCDLVIVRGCSVQVIKEKYNGPVVGVPVTKDDIVSSVEECRERMTPKKIGFIGDVGGDYSTYEELWDLDSLAGLERNIYVADTPYEVENAVDRAVEDGCDVLIGGGHTDKCVLKKGYNVYRSIVKTSEEDIVKALNLAATFILSLEREKNQVNMFRYVAENVSDGLIYVDSNDCVRIMNRATRMIAGIEMGEDNMISARIPFMADDFYKAKNGQTNLENVIFNRHSMKMSVDFIPIVGEESGTSQYQGMLITVRDIRQFQHKEIQIRNKLGENGFYAKYEFKDILYHSEEMEHVMKKAQKYAMVSSNVLIYGETGTGKELIAQSMHNVSERKNGPFVAVNCASLPENLMESELFGYEEGSFTGAVKGGKAGLFEMAHKGTIFLDEISELPLGFQNKLLRVIQEREVRRVGGKKVIKIDVRIIAATNRNLKTMIEKGLFRADLFYRLNVLQLSVPPLRERKGDIEILARHYLLYYSKKFGTVAVDFTDEALKLLARYPFRGNIRELRNLMERLSVMTENRKAGCREVIEALEEDMPEEMNVQLDTEVSEIQKEEVVRLLEEFHNNKSRVARELGVNRTTLWRKMKKWGLEV